MVKNEQSSSAVYGLFYEVEYEGSSLLGLYFLEGEAEAAREAFIAEQMVGYLFRVEEELEHQRRCTVVRQLAMGQVPSFHFAA